MINHIDVIFFCVRIRGLVKNIVKSRSHGICVQIFFIFASVCVYQIVLHGFDAIVFVFV